MTVVILEDAAADIELGRRFMNPVKRELGTISSKQSLPILIHS